MMIWATRDGYIHIENDALRSIDAAFLGEVAQNYFQKHPDLLRVRLGDEESPGLRRGCYFDYEDAK